MERVFRCVNKDSRLESLEELRPLFGEGTHSELQVRSHVGSEWWKENPYTRHFYHQVSTLQNLRLISHFCLTCAIALITVFFRSNIDYFIAVFL